MATTACRYCQPGYFCMECGTEEQLRRAGLLPTEPEVWVLFKDLPFTGQLHEGKCPSHPEGRWLSKGPGRSVFFCPEDLSTVECNCSIEETLLWLTEDAG